MRATRLAGALAALAVIIGTPTIEAHADSIVGQGNKDHIGLRAGKDGAAGHGGKGGRSGPSKAKQPRLLAKGRAVSPSSAPVSPSSAPVSVSVMPPPDAKVDPNNPRLACIIHDCSYAKPPAPTAGTVGGTTAPAPPTMADLVIAAQTAVANMPITPTRTVMQPAANALINVPSNFYAVPNPQTMNTILLGIPVTVTVTPTSFTWYPGEDSVIGPTTNPGGPYPQLTNTHVYQKTGNYVVTQTTSYTATLSAPGYGTSVIPGVLQTTTVIGTLTVRQAPVTHVNPDR